MSFMTRPVKQPPCHTRKSARFPSPVAHRHYALSATCPFPDTQSVKKAQYQRPSRPLFPLPPFCRCGDQKEEVPFPRAQKVIFFRATDTPAEQLLALPTLSFQNPLPDLAFSKPKALRIGTFRFLIESWKGMLETMARFLFENYRFHDVFLAFARDTKPVWMYSSELSSRSAACLDHGLWIDTNGDAVRLVNRAKKYWRHVTSRSTSPRVCSRIFPIQNLVTRTTSVNGASARSAGRKLRQSQRTCPIRS